MQLELLREDFTTLKWIESSAVPCRGDRVQVGPRAYEVERIIWVFRQTDTTVQIILHQIAGNHDR